MGPQPVPETRVRRWPLNWSFLEGVRLGPVWPFHGRREAGRWVLMVASALSPLGSLSLLGGTPFHPPGPRHLRPCPLTKPERVTGPDSAVIAEVPSVGEPSPEGSWPWIWGKTGGSRNNRAGELRQYEARQQEQWLHPQDPGIPLSQAARLPTAQPESLTYVIIIN